jgi:hypothetical protein
MRRKFVEYLGTDCFHFCRIPVELSVVTARRIQNVRSAPQNARITSYSMYIVGPYTMAVASRRWVWSDISPVFTDFSDWSSGVEYLAFLSKQGEKMVSSEPSKLRKKWVPGEMIFSPWWKSVEFWPSIFSQSFSNLWPEGYRVHVDRCITCKMSLRHKY